MRVNQTPESKGPWTGVNGRIWRHTIGRVSNTVRIPINLIASLVQLFKMAGKTVVLPITYTVVGVHWLIKKDSESYKGSMSIRGIAIDTIGFLGLLKNTAVCFKNVIVAPSKESTGFRKGVTRTWKVLRGDLHDVNKLYTITALFHKFVYPNK